MMTKEAFTKIVNFMIPEVRVLEIGQGGAGMRGLKLCIILMVCINIYLIDCKCIKGLYCSFFLP